MKKLILLKVVMLMIITLHRQVSAQALPADTTGTRQLSKELDISISKAITLKSALAINQEQLRSLLNDNTIKLTQRKAQISMLVRERDSRIAAILTATELQRFKDVVNNRMAGKRKQENEQLSRVKKEEMDRQHLFTAPNKH